MNFTKRENPVKIIRWSNNVTFENGNIGYMKCMSGRMEEIKAYAERIAKENGTTVEVII